MKTFALCAAGLIALAATPLSVRADDAPVAAPAVTLPSAPPAGAVVLFSGKAEDLAGNWVKRYAKEAPGWTLGADGGITPNRTDITSKREFGDCLLHVEFSVPAGDGNAGVALQGRYEIQIYNSHGKKLEATTGAAFYSQTAGKFNAAKKAGEWQSYDILFRAPRFDAAGNVTEPARATVFWNGVIVHNNETFKGPTGIQYGEFKGESKSGPIVLQGDHDAVRYRNIWVLPL